jgi:hypothetical protein
MITNDFTGIGDINFDQPVYHMSTPTQVTGIHREAAHGWDGFDFVLVFVGHVWVLIRVI